VAGTYGGTTPGTALHRPYPQPWLSARTAKQAEMLRRVGAMGLGFEPAQDNPIILSPYY